MSEITVKVFANLREILGNKTIKLSISKEKPVLMDVLNELLTRYPQVEKELLIDGNNWNELYRVFYDGKNIPPSEFNNIVIVSKEIVILPPSGGG